MNNYNGVNSMGSNLNQFSQQQSRNSAFPTYFNPTSMANAASTNNIVWVQGIEGAKAFQLNPNSVTILLDSEVDGKMYIKVSDNIGMCTLRTFDYKEVPATDKVTVNKDLDLSQYVTKAELDELVKELKEILTHDKVISTTPTTTTNTTSSNKSDDSGFFAKF